MTDAREVGGRRVVVGLIATLTAASAAFGAVLGYILPVWTGIEALAVFGASVPITPITFGLYGGVTFGTGLVTFLFVVRAISRFDEHAV